MLFSSCRDCTCPALLPYPALEELFSHISHSFMYAQRGGGHEKVLSAKKLLAPATGMFRQEEFWYFEGENLANLESDGFRLSRSSGHGRLFMLLPAGATVPSPQINDVPLTSPYGTVYGDQLDVPLMWDFKLSSQTLTKSDRIEPSGPFAGYVTSPCLVEQPAQAQLHHGGCRLPEMQRQSAHCEVSLWGDKGGRHLLHAGTLSGLHRLFRQGERPL